jgi:type II secretory pathway pseudopilin PulG
MTNPLVIRSAGADKIDGEGVDSRSTEQRMLNQKGATYLLLMLSIVLISIAVTAAAKQWKTVIQREKEADLLARGIEIQTAIALYSATKKRTGNVQPTAAVQGVTPGGPAQGTVAGGELYPLTLEELTKLPKPFLRKAYQDPITGRDWEYVRDPTTGRIKGVRSPSKDIATKQHDFPAVVHHFEGLQLHHDWVFQHPSASAIGTPQVPVPALTPPVNK